MNTTRVGTHKWINKGTGLDAKGKFTEWQCEHCKSVARKYPAGEPPQGGRCANNPSKG